MNMEKPAVADTMIKRMTLALADEFTRQAQIDLFHVDSSNLPYVTIDGTLDLKEAVLVILGELRQPSDAMLKAGTTADWVGIVEGRDGESISPDQYEKYDDAADKWVTVQRPGIWRAMIDAALSEPN